MKGDGTGSNGSNGSDLPTFRQMLDEIPVGNRILGEHRGPRIAMSHLVQEIDTYVLGPPTRDHTIILHLGGAVHVRRFYEGKLTGSISRLGGTTIAPAGREAGWSFDGPVEVLHIYIGADVLSEIAEEDLGIDAETLEVFDTMGADDPFVRSLGTLICRELATASPASRMVLDSLERTVAHHLLRGYSNRGAMTGTALYAADQSQERMAVAKAREYITERLSSGPSLQEVASHVGLSPFHFQRVFKAETGLSPHQFLIQTRVTQARMMLEGDQSLAEIAFACGFSSQQRMTTVFRRTLGITPGRYRRMAE